MQYTIPLLQIPPLPIPPPPPNTAAHFQVPNKGSVGYIWLPIPLISEYRRFSVSPEIGGIWGCRLYLDLDMQPMIFPQSSMWIVAKLEH